MILKCEDCGEEIEINPEEYNNKTVCPVCSGDNFKAGSRSGMFFEMMRLLEETEQNTPENMPDVIIAENVRGLKPYLPVLRLEYERHGYTAHVEMFNSKYWNVPQNRERYAVVGTRDNLKLQFSFPEEQHDFVPKLSDYLEENVDEKYYLSDEKAKVIIDQALEKLETMGKCHACITPDRVNKRQNGPRAKADEEPMLTLTAQDLHGIIQKVFLTSDGVAYCCDASYYKGIGPSAVGRAKRTHIVEYKNEKYLVRKLTPTEYGTLQAFPMKNWKQVVSDSQAYKQFGNAVTTTVFSAVALEIKKTILQSEREEQDMEEGKGFTGMNTPEVGEATAAAVEEKTETKEKENGVRIEPEMLAKYITMDLFDMKLIPEINLDVIGETITNNLYNFCGKIIGEIEEEKRDWEAAENAVNDILSKYAPNGYMGKMIYPVIIPLKERLESGERTADLFNEIVEATR